MEIYYQHSAILRSDHLALLPSPGHPPLFSGVAAALQGLGPDPLTLETAGCDTAVTGIVRSFAAKGIS